MSLDHRSRVCLLCVFVVCVCCVCLLCVFVVVFVVVACWRRTGQPLQVFEGHQVGADVLLPVDGLRQQEVQVVQRHGGHQGEHAVLVGDLHRDVDSTQRTSGSVINNNTQLLQKVLVKVCLVAPTGWDAPCASHPGT